MTACSASKIVTTLDIPGTVQVGDITIYGNLAFVVGTQGGWLSPFTDQQNIGPTGNLVLATVNITDPLHPQLISTEVIDRRRRGDWAATWSRWATTDSPSRAWATPPTPPQLFVVDASDPSHIKVVDRDRPARQRPRRGDRRHLSLCRG